MDREFTYTDIELPNFLAMHLGTNTDFTATLMPNNPELINIWERPYESFKGKFPRFDRQLVDSNAGYDLTRVLYIARLCLENDIKPFWKLNLNGEIYSLHPRAEFILHQVLDGGKYKEPWKVVEKAFRTPSMGGSLKRWNIIQFENVEKRQVLEAKKAIRRFIREGYVVTNIHAHLNPRSGTSDHYYDTFECDGTLQVERGRIFYDGNAAENFNPNNVPRRYPEDTRGDEEEQLEKLIESPTKQLSLPDCGE